MEHEQEILRQLQVDMNGLKGCLESHDIELFWACIEDLETTAKNAIDGRHE